MQKTPDNPLSPASVPGPAGAADWRGSLAPLSRYWNIIAFKTYANLKRDIDKTYLGTLWWVLEPVLTTAVLYVVFTYIQHTKTQAFIVFLLIGNVVYGHFSSSINTGAGALIANAGLMQQVRLPKSLYPIIAVCNLTWKFLFSLVVIFPMLWLLHCPVSLPYLALPLLLAFQVFAVVGFSLPFAILMPFFQDARTLLSTLLNVGFWISGILFPIEMVPPAWRPWFYLNPAATLIDGYRTVLIHAQWPVWGNFLGPLAICAAFWGAGILLMRRLGGKVTKLPL